MYICTCTYRQEICALWCHTIPLPLHAHAQTPQDAAVKNQLNTHFMCIHYECLCRKVCDCDEKIGKRRAFLQIFYGVFSHTQIIYYFVDLYFKRWQELARDQTPRHLYHFHSFSLFAYKVGMCATGPKTHDATTKRPNCMCVFCVIDKYPLRTRDWHVFQYFNNCGIVFSSDR